MPVLIDTCGWIEWVTDGLLAEQYRPFLTPIDEILVPVPVQFELYKWVKRERNESMALEIIGLTEQGNVIELNTNITLLSADLSMEHQLSFADALIYGCAYHHGVKLITSDDHFEGLHGVIYLAKK